MSSSCEQLIISLLWIYNSIKVLIESKRSHAPNPMSFCSPSPIGENSSAINCLMSLNATFLFVNNSRKFVFADDSSFVQHSMIPMASNSENFQFSCKFLRSS